MVDQNDRGCLGLSPRLKTSFMVSVELRMPSESIYYGEPKTLSGWPRRGRFFSFSKGGDDLIKDSVSNCVDLAWVEHWYIGGVLPSRFHQNIDHSPFLLFSLLVSSKLLFVCKLNTVIIEPKFIR